MVNAGASVGEEVGRSWLTAGHQPVERSIRCTPGNPVFPDARAVISVDDPTPMVILCARHAS